MGNRPTEDATTSSPVRPSQLVAANREGDTLTITLKGVLDATPRLPIEPAVTELLEHNDRVLVMDFNEVRLLDTAGVRELLALWHTVRTRGMAVRIERAREQPLAVLRLLRLQGLFHEQSDQQVPVGMGR
jgi:anti-sigma B factor antagonist